jgi:hypothetical protein
MDNVSRVLIEVRRLSARTGLGALGRKREGCCEEEEEQQPERQPEQQPYSMRNHHFPFCVLGKI